MTELVVETPEGVSLRYELAGAGSRAAAGLIDLTILVSLYMVVMLLVFVIATQDPTALSSVVFGLLAGGFLLLPALYQLGFTAFWDGRTPGKQILGLRVTDAAGYPAGTLQLLLRSLFWPLEAMVLVFPVPVSLILITLTERRQRLGDLVAGTVVLRERIPSVEAEPFPRETWSGLATKRLELVPALAARLDAEDDRFLRSLLGRRDLSRTSRGRLVQSAARRYLEVLGLGTEASTGRESAAAVLKEIYLFLREARGYAPPESPTASSGSRGSRGSRGKGPRGRRRRTRTNPAAASAGDPGSAPAPRSPAR